MAFADLPAQPPMSPAAEQYATFCFTHTAQAQARTRHVLDIPFGADYWQKLDLYLPHDPGVAGVPTLLFMHGGYWTHGYKEWLGFMAPALVSLPALFVSVGYRLSPAVKHPAALEDCLAALTWAYHHVAAYGGDPQRLFVGGHSAGGHLAALLALQPALRTARGLPAEVIKACFPVSGVYDVEGDIPQDRLQAFLSRRRVGPKPARCITPLAIRPPFCWLWARRTSRSSMPRPTLWLQPCARRKHLWSFWRSRRRIIFRSICGP